MKYFNRNINLISHKMSHKRDRCRAHFWQLPSAGTWIKYNIRFDRFRQLAGKGPGVSGDFGIFGPIFIPGTAMRFHENAAELLPRRRFAYREFGTVN